MVNDSKISALTRAHMEQQRLRDQNKQLRSIIIELWIKTEKVLDSVEETKNSKLAYRISVLRRHLNDAKWVISDMSLGPVEFYETKAKEEIRSRVAAELTLPFGDRNQIEDGS